MSPDDFDIEHFPTNPTALRMLSRISPIYDRSYVGKWIFEVMGADMDDVRLRFEELRAQAFPETATWGLFYWEQRYGLPVGGGFDYAVVKMPDVQLQAVFGPLAVILHAAADVRARVRRRVVVHVEQPVIPVLAVIPADVQARVRRVEVPVIRDAPGMPRPSSAARMTPKFSPPLLTERRAC